MSLGTVVFCLFLVTSSPVYTDNCFKVSLLFCLLICALSLSVYLQLSDPAAHSEPVESLGNVSASFIMTDITESGLFALYVEVREISPDLTETQPAITSGLAAHLYGHSSTTVRHPHPGPVLLLFTGDICCLYLHLQVNIKTSCGLTLLCNISRDNFAILVRVLLHVCLHILGCHILLMTQVRMRDTFMKVGQSLLVKRQLVMEKQLKEKMINSVMPPKVADWLMKRGIEDEDEDVDIDSETGSMMRKISSPRSSNQGDIRTIFRPFNMNAMENVSILFADIVGFTEMSSNKSANQLVELLNDLFGR